MVETDDNALAARAGNGDQQAFARLLERHYDLIFKTAFKWCGNRHDAEDVAQEVCVKLARVLCGFKGRSAFSTWLYRVTVNAVRDFQRGQSREAERIGAAALMRDIEDDTNAADEALASLWQAVRALPPKQRDAVLLVHAQGLTHAQAADILECAEGTVSWHIREARKKLKTLLEE